jgi:hypothetical protein
METGDRNRAHYVIQGSLDYYRYGYDRRMKAREDHGEIA